MKLIALILMTLLPGVAAAQVSGPVHTVNAGAFQRMIHGSTDPGDLERAQLFIGYTLATTDILMSLGQICPTEGSTGKTINDVVSKFILSNSGIAHRSAVEMTSMALVQSYPCERFVPQPIPSPKSMLPGGGR